MAKLTMVLTIFYIGFSFDKSKQDRMDIENDGQTGDFELQVHEDKMQD